MNGKPNRGGETDEQVRRYIKSVIEKRNAAIRGSATRRQLDDIFVTGLDGDDAHEFPELCQAFFKGRRDPVKLGTDVQRRWEKENWSE